MTGDEPRHTEMAERSGIDLTVDEFYEPCHGDGRAKPVLKSIPLTSMRGRETASSYDTSGCLNADGLSDCVLVFPVF
jgi:hypothetical protein